MLGNRVFGLDVLRATAISLVVVSHCSYMFYETTDNPILLGIRSLGAIGVDLFFVLSGYLIGGILLKQIEKNRTSFKDLFWFWKRRWFRTLPNYYLVLIINILIVLIANEDLPSKLLLYFPFLQNFVGPHPDFFTEAWSLSIEEYSYLILPLSLYFGFAIFKRQKSKQHIFLWITVALIAIQFLFKIWYYVETDVASYKAWSASFRKVVPYRLDAIYYGFILIYCVRKFSDFFKKNRKVLFLVSLIIFLLTHFIIFRYNVLPQTHLAFYVFAYLPLIAVCCALTFPLATKLKPPKGLHKLVFFVSTRSYAIYLLNYSIVFLNIKKVFNISARPVPVKVLAMLLFLILTILLSELLYRFFEKPILDYRDKKFVRPKSNL